MSFDTAAYLRKATSRAKSDVANKLISMRLHDISRRAVAAVGLSVTDAKYAKAVAAVFGDACAYCSRRLETDRASVEHLDGMNRFRAGLHVPGNVVVACINCNREKRRDDQLVTLVLAESGWSSFLSHDSSRCTSACKTCGYWAAMWSNLQERRERLRAAANKITEFRQSYESSLGWSMKARQTLQGRLALLYSECQEFAVTRIQSLANELFSEISRST